MKSYFKLFIKIFIYLTLSFIALTIITFTITHFVTTPSNDRDWNDDQVILPHAEFDNNLITIYNIRNFKYASTTSYTPSYYNKTFDINKIKKVWYVVEPFEGIPGSAHTFLSFEFENNQFVAISVEIRKEKGESYHPIRGLFNQYELMYVIADENDAIKLRSNYRKDLVYLYPANTTKEKIQELFLSMIKRANDLKENPEFYNTITNTCTTNIVSHINKITPKKIPLFSLSVIFPANSDKLAYDLGMFDTDLNFEQARERFYINNRAEKYANDPNFSVKIRQEN